MASTETLPATPSNPAGPSGAAPRGTAPPEFPGCKPVHLPRAEIERFEGRLEYWDAATETAWICEPTTSYHERPARLLTRLAEVIARVRGSHIECYGSMDLLLRDEHGEPQRIMQADESLYLHPAHARLPGAAMVVGADDLPDVVLEVDHTTDARRGKLALYESWGFPEVWVDVPDAPSPSRPRARRPGLTIHLLAHGHYRVAAESRALPGWTAAEIHEALNEAEPSARTSAGAILGLDRCPETKTLRRKIRLLTSAEHTVRDWQSALARTWATEHQDDWATLAVDGHVKVYTGRKGRLPKHFVARQKLCLPASVSYWVNALGGAPLLCLHKALDPKLIKAIEQDVVPHLQHLGVVPEAAPDLTRPDAGVPALTLVFDREGWSPDLFKRLARRGIACITWHKNFKGEDWPEEDFRTLEVLIHGPAGTSATTVDLAEQPIVLRNGLTVRQIRRRLANGRQVPVITTHPQMPLVQVAGAMFSRWSQENFFKYMREQFNLDSLPSHDLAPLDPDAQVVNPVRRALEKTIRRLRSRLATARNRLAEALQEHHRDTATRLDADANALAAELDQLKQQRAHTLTHVRAGDLPEQDKLDALPVGGRLFLDLVRMIAYRAETRMMAPVITTQGKKPNARRLLRALLTSDANIIPLPAKGILRIQLLGLGSDACDRMLAPLVEELNATRTIYPGTDLRLVYELAGDPPPEVSPDSG